MKLIDKDKLEYRRITIEGEGMYNAVLQCNIENAEVIEAIPISWFYKELIEQMYNRNLSSDVMSVFHEIIAKWEKENG